MTSIKLGEIPFYGTRGSSAWALTKRNREVLDFTPSRVKNIFEFTKLRN